MIYEGDEGETFDNRWGQVGERWGKDGGADPRDQLQRGNEIRWGDNRILNFTFAGASVQSQSQESIIQVDGIARVWSLNLALALLGPNGAIAAGDSVSCIFRIIVGLGSSRIQMARVLTSATFVNVPPLITNLIVSDIPASQIIVGVDLTYSAAAARAPSLQVSAAAAPVIR
jgi:hypothetical protein